MRSLTRWVAAAVAVPAAVLLVTAAPAVADGVLVDAEDCLTGRNDVDDYAARSSVGTTDYTLYCGDPTKGVLHIDEGHPIVATANRAFRDCVSTIAGRGRDIRAGNTPGTVVRELAGVGLVVHEPDARRLPSLFDPRSITTAYTFAGARGNDWQNCALFGDGVVA